MHDPKTRTLPPLDRATPGELSETLAHWDELATADLVRLAAHPRSARKLAGLRAVEGWMREREEGVERAAEEAFDPARCPSAEELYDFGRGPGFRHLDEEREELLARHLATCGACSELVGSLQSPPPLPVEAFAPSPEPSHLEPESEPARPLRSSSTWAPFLVAASLAGLLLVPFVLGPRKASLADLPAGAVFRGQSDFLGQGAGALHFPRGPLLALPSTDGPRAIPRFELSALPDAAEYRVEVHRHDGGAFDAGNRIQNLHASTADFAAPSPAAPLLEGGPLAPGHYSWRAFAEVDGLERELGSLDFEVVEQPELAARVAELSPSSSLSRRVEQILELHARGLLSDARRLARDLPESPEREAYLRPPAR